MSSRHIVTSYLSDEVLLQRLVLLHFTGVPENEGQQQHQCQHEPHQSLSMSEQVDCSYDRRTKQQRQKAL